MKNIKLSKYTNNNGICYLPKSLSGSEFLQDCKISAIILDEIHSCKFNPLMIESSSHTKWKFSPLINISKNSKNNRFEFLELYGVIPKPKNNNVKLYRKKWEKYAPSGIFNRANENSFGTVLAKNVHDVIISHANYCEYGLIVFNKFSGDGIFIDGSYNTIEDIDSEIALKAIAYNRKHRDIVQFASKGLMTHNIINSIKYRIGNSHILAKSPNGCIIHTDGRLIKTKIQNVDIISNTQEHGVSSVYLRDSLIHVVRLQNHDSNRIPYVILKDRKGLGKSINNTIYLPKSVKVIAPLQNNIYHD